MNLTSDTCPIWGTPAHHFGHDQGGLRVESPRAGGKYVVSGTAEELLKAADDQQKAHLTTWLVKQRALGEEWPWVASSTLAEVKNGRGSAVADRADGVLRFLAGRTELLGARVRFRLQAWPQEHDDLTVAYFGLLAHSECVGENDLDFLLDSPVQPHRLGDPERPARKSLGSHLRRHRGRVKSPTAFARGRLTTNEPAVLRVVAGPTKSKP